jgi:hypothetical protein
MWCAVLRVANNKQRLTKRSRSPQGGHGLPGRIKAFLDSRANFPLTPRTLTAFIVLRALCASCHRQKSGNAQTFRLKEWKTGGASSDSPDGVGAS